MTPLDVSTSTTQETRMNEQDAYSPQRIADRLAIQDVLYRWCRAIDRLDFDEIRGRLQAELKQLHGDLTTLMAAALQAGNEAFSDDKGQYVITGERNLLEVDDLASNMSRLRELFSLFDQRTQLASLLDLSQRADGVQIFIGGESGLAPLDECSVVTAPYEVQGQVVGTVGVIGPTRMAYERVIPIVDVTAKLLSSALSQT